jgi:hypothetical protein
MCLSCDFFYSYSRKNWFNSTMGPWWQLKPLQQNGPTSAHRSLSWTRSIQSMPQLTISLRSVLILTFYLRLGLPSDLFPSVSPTEFLYAFLFHRACYMPYPSHLPWLDHSNYIWWRVQVMKLLLALLLQVHLFQMSRTRKFRFPRAKTVSCNMFEKILLISALGMNCVFVLFTQSLACVCLL